MSNVDTARSAYEAFGRGDLEALKEMMAEDATWLTSDELPLGGETKGRDEIIGNFAQIPSYWTRSASSPRSSSTPASGWWCGEPNGRATTAAASRHRSPTCSGSPTARSPAASSTPTAPRRQRSSPRKAATATKARRPRGAPRPRRAARRAGGRRNRAPSPRRRGSSRRAGGYAGGWGRSFAAHRVEPLDAAIAAPPPASRSRSERPRWRRRPESARERPQHRRRGLASSMLTSPRRRRMRSRSPRPRSGEAPASRVPQQGRAVSAGSWRSSIRAASARTSASCSASHGAPARPGSAGRRAERSPSSAWPRS